MSYCVSCLYSYRFDTFSVFMTCLHNCAGSIEPTVFGFLGFFWRGIHRGRWHMSKVQDQCHSQLRQRVTLLIILVSEIFNPFDFLPGFIIEKQYCPKGNVALRCYESNSIILIALLYFCHSSKSIPFYFEWVDLYEMQMSDWPSTSKYDEWYERSVN